MLSRCSEVHSFTLYSLTEKFSRTLDPAVQVVDSIYNELKKNTVTSAKIALACKISSQGTMTDSKVRSDGRIVFYALEIV